METTRFQCAELLLGEDVGMRTRAQVRNEGTDHVGYDFLRCYFDILFYV